MINLTRWRQDAKFRRPSKRTIHAGRKAWRNHFSFTGFSVNCLWGQRAPPSAYTTPGYAPRTGQACQQQLSAVTGTVAVAVQRNVIYSLPSWLRRNADRCNAYLVISWKIRREPVRRAIRNAYDPPNVSLTGLCLGFSVPKISRYSNSICTSVRPWTCLRFWCLENFILVPLTSNFMFCTFWFSFSRFLHFHPLYLWYFCTFIFYSNNSQKLYTYCI